MKDRARRIFRSHRGLLVFLLTVVAVHLWHAHWLAAVTVASVAGWIAGEVDIDERRRQRSETRIY